MRTILNILADVLTLIALSVASIGLVGLHSAVQTAWLNVNLDPRWLTNVSIATGQNIAGAGVCLGLLGAALVASLVAPLNPLARRLLTLGMFGCSFVAMLFLVALMTLLERLQMPMEIVFLRDDGQGMIVAAMVGTAFAIFFSLVRMLWTMPPESSSAPARQDLYAAAPAPLTSASPPPLSHEDVPLRTIGEASAAPAQGIRAERGR